MPPDDAATQSPIVKRLLVERTNDIGGPSVSNRSSIVQCVAVTTVKSGELEGIKNQCGSFQS